MAINKPFLRNFRGFVDSPNSGYSSWAYVIDNDYSENPNLYVRSFLIIQSELKELFEYIEPSDVNLDTYSLRILQLLLRTCIEIESNFKAILRENIYTKTKTLNIKDYKLINKTHHLDSYRISVPFWTGERNEFQPFFSWKVNKSLEWYQAYNNVKHDRLNHFKDANLNNLLMAITGLLALLSSQFGTESFSTGDKSLGIGSEYSYYEGSFGIGDFFTVKFPTNWSDEEKYDFDWSELKEQQNRFQKIDYDVLSKAD